MFASNARIWSALELTGVVMVFAATWFLGKSFYLPYVGPLTVIVSVSAASVLLRLRGQTWRDLGLKMPRSIRSFAAGVLITALSVASVAVLVTLLVPYLEMLTGPHAESGFFSHFQNFTEYITALVIAWTAAAICEELLFRGFVLNRFAEMFGSSAGAWALALFFQSGVFGLCHFAQGPFGIIQTGVIGLLFGSCYLIGRRNLLPLIFAHGIVDTISLSQTFFGGH